MSFSLDLALGSRRPLNAGAAIGSSEAPKQIELFPPGTFNTLLN